MGFGGEGHPAVQRTRAAASAGLGSLGRETQIPGTQPAPTLVR